MQTLPKTSQFIHAQVGIGSSIEATSDDLNGADKPVSIPVIVGITVQPTEDTNGNMVRPRMANHNNRNYWAIDVHW
jgi:hypothetical protein